MAEEPNLEVAVKPNLEMVVLELVVYQDQLQDIYDDLDEKQVEEESEARQEKMNGIQSRIDLVQAAIDALESVE